MEQKINIRRAVPIDAEIISSLTAGVQRLHVEAEPEIFVPPANENFTADLHREWLGSLDNYYFICEVGGEVAGYIFLRHFRREENAFTYTREYIHIDQISVLPKYRGKGCGRQLVEQAFRLAEEMDISEINLSTWEFNKDAQEFFKKMGFDIYLIQMRRRVK